MNAPPGPRRSMTLFEAASQFCRYPTPWLLGTALAAALIARLAVGDWQPADAVVPVVMAAAFPFVEWLIHVVILHWRPRRIAGLVVDPLLARKHRQHHRDPRDTALVFIPLPALFAALASALAIALWAFPRTGLGLTFLVVILAFGLGYEWTHYLVHTGYKPKTRLYHAIWRDHRLHHYKNENYWFGVTTPGTADRVLRTYPNPSSVGTSPTAKNLYNSGPGATSLGRARL